MGKSIVWYVFNSRRRKEKRKNRIQITRKYGKVNKNNHKNRTGHKEWKNSYHLLSV